MTSLARAEHKNGILAVFLRATLAHLFLALFRTRVVGKENVPAQGAILAGNHLSYMDPVLLWCASPRRTFFMAKRELWGSKLLGWLLDHLWGFPVNRGEPDRAAITTATDLLKAGELVGMFPEGSRAAGDGQELGQAHGGVAFIALRAGAPVVPVAFVGTEQVWPRGQRYPRLRRVSIYLGKPIDTAAVCPECGRKERVQALTQVIMDGIAEVLEQARKESA